MKLWLSKCWRYITRLKYPRAGAAAAVTVATGTALAIFTFQTAQSWIDENAKHASNRWALPITAAATVCALTLALYFAYLAFIAKASPREPVPDAYKRYADGVVAYGQALHAEKRDPAMLRLRENSSLTLHVLGFHRERVRIGQWALEAAQFVNDDLAILSILIDDLGWANYLLSSDDGAANIEKAIRFGEQLPGDPLEPKRSLLIAKAFRHLGVMNTARTNELQRQDFTSARKLLQRIQPEAEREASTDIAHVDYAEALAIATVLEVNSSGAVRRTDAEGMVSLYEGIELVRKARAGFRTLGDQGRYAKSLVLEVRLLEAAHESNEAAQLIPLRDRAVAASVWARPAGRAFITGR